MTIAITDYGRGNLYSLGHALRAVGAEFVVTSEPKIVSAATAIIIPGVGAFGDCASELRGRGLVDPILQAVRAGKPVLGICVGMQMLADESHEFGTHAGLGLVPGTVRRLAAPRSDDPDSIRIPNVGWRKLRILRNDPLLDGIADGEMMYFVHSFAEDVRDPADLSAVIDVNGSAAAAIVRRDNVAGCQFHPEKSGTAGLRLLSNFVRNAAATVSALRQPAENQDRTTIVSA